MLQVLRGCIKHPVYRFAWKSLRALNCTDSTFLKSPNFDPSLLRSIFFLKTRFSFNRSQAIQDNERIFSEPITNQKQPSNYRRRCNIFLTHERLPLIRNKLFIVLHRKAESEPGWGADGSQRSWELSDFRFQWKIFVLTFCQREKKFEQFFFRLQTHFSWLHCLKLVGATTIGQMTSCQKSFG